MNTPCICPSSNKKSRNISRRASVSKHYFTDKSIQRGGDHLEFKPVYAKQFPIPKASEKEKAAIAKLVQKCLDAKGENCEAWEQEIDDRLSTLYGL